MDRCRLALFHAHLDVGWFCEPCGASKKESVWGRSEWGIRISDIETVRRPHDIVFATNVFLETILNELRRLKFSQHPTTVL